MVRQPDISIIVPTYKREREVMRLILSLFNQTLAPERFEILIVSNFSQVGLEKQIRELVQYSTTKVRFLCAFKKGVNASRNKGIDHAKGRILLFLDDDILVENPQYLENLIQHHDENPEALIIGGPLDAPEEMSSTEEAYYLQRAFDFERASLAGNKTLLLAGGNVSYKSELFDRRLRFRSEIDWGHADTEFHNRLLVLGKSLYVFDDLNVTHKLHLGFLGLIWRSFRRGYNSYKLNLFKKNHSHLATVDFSRLNAWYSESSSKSWRAKWVWVLLYYFAFFEEMGRIYARKPSRIRLPLLFFKTLYSWHRQYGGPFEVSRQSINKGIS